MSPAHTICAGPLLPEARGASRRRSALRQHLNRPTEPKYLCLARLVWSIKKRFVPDPPYEPERHSAWAWLSTLTSSA